MQAREARLPIARMTDFGPYPSQRHIGEPAVVAMVSVIGGAFGKQAHLAVDEPRHHRTELAVGSARYVTGGAAQPPPPVIANAPIIAATDPYHVRA